MERSEYLPVNTQATLVQSFPSASSGDDVRVTVYNISTATTDINDVAMTYVNGVNWKYTGWTPTTGGMYIVTFTNNTLSVSYYLYANVIGTTAPSPAGGSGGSTLTVLRTKFLKMIDNWNSNDLTGTNSSGEIADLCINDGLQLIYSQLKDSKYMEAYASTLSSVGGQSYINISGISDADEIRAIKDTTNNWKLLRITAEQYFRESPNPAVITGVPYRYCRIFNRVYLDPQPVTAQTYTVEYVKNYGRLASDSDQALIDSRYDDWIMKEAHCIWMKMEDPASTALSFLVNERNEAREIYRNDIMSGFDLSIVADSHFTRGRRWRDWKSPINGA